MKPTLEQRLDILVGFIGLFLILRALIIALYISVLPSTLLYGIILGLQFLMPEVDQLYWFSYWQVLLSGILVAFADSIVATYKK